MKDYKKVIIALSGGVDSAVAAALLKKQGFEVAGVFFRFFSSRTSSFQAKKISKKLGISLKIIDARKEFKKRVIDYFIASYKKGLTPNPCVACNKEMKFQVLFDLMKKYKADYVATGHYARLGREFSIFNFQFSNNSKISKFSNTKLLEAKDKNKDQSYFLYRLTQKDLAKIIFPLGDYRKSEVKKIAKKMKLPVAENESQDICFVAENSIGDFLKKNIKSKIGEIREIGGNILGKHKGLPFYTIGQRKGIEIGGTGPYWVIGKNVLKNELVVTDDPKKLFTDKFWVNQVNWVNQKVKFPLRAKIRIRYRAEKFSAIIRKVRGEKLEVRSERFLRAVTPGQAAVFYKNGEVLGGGVII
ncbi:MAG: tRNA 2-thiouridine(34) synthase MnmA [Candidatus Moranbacteria bacterium CG_4_10_14_3_um_filter_44_15]|nr:MAG: tRNA 2-thiouridine(34) synthase MnmA [Candidatus Moranbacteria bacterium CG06_land_8_20_14_3_00_43_56]PIV84513.1 MAG: tRNA 2-thiouridine(34) synthase MnmA [Candidatus Moranbacteria bacterium CG17_big_fil_post_rev_8_21_14_2_50_44_12]PIW93246.1 MAG: tRNA 2-thiouridine(34) synthase MnmA [Candidatus Moranbacteria bacterium CG_4_8_14_3_um_filter_43_15]PIX91001.1 MAG: tRNA 2-thiouridine(34) synthase MnmA [Candidatus Moranbacteria bacterium CG_4_10_14_3_um_filter_44_15]PJA86261.1 MAG: tRNA 2-t